MKKTIILLCLVALFFSSCSTQKNNKSEESTQTPSALVSNQMADPCAAENLLDEVEKVQDLINAFQDIAYLSNFTPQTELVVPILEMQKVRRELQKLNVPACEENIKSASLNYMNSTINYLAYFMSGKESENTVAGIQNSQVLWQVVLNEFNILLTSAGLVPDELPESSSAPPLTPDNSIFIINEGTKRVNVRNLPDLNSNVIASMEPGMQAIGLSRNEIGDWLRINLDGVIGWVFSQTVSPSDPIEQLPLYNSIQEN